MYSFCFLSLLCRKLPYSKFFLPYTAVINPKFRAISMAVSVKMKTKLLLIFTKNNQNLLTAKTKKYYTYYKRESR